MYNGNGAKFVGADATLYNAVPGAIIDGLAIPVALPVGTYMITQVATVSGFPGAIDGGDDPVPGDILVVNTGISILPVVGDQVLTLELTEQCDASSWTMSFTKPPLDVTTFCDMIKTYRAGQADMTGSMTGIFRAGTTDDKDGFLRTFIPIVRQDGALSFDKFKQEEKIYIGLFYINKNVSLADPMFIVGAFQLLGLSPGAAQDDAQSFESEFKFAPWAYEGISLKPTFHRIGDGTV